MSRSRPSLREQFLRLAKQRMKDLGLTQKELAERIGASQPYVSQLLAGKFSVGQDVMDQVAQALDCELELKFLTRHK